MILTINVEQISQCRLFNLERRSSGSLAVVRCDEVEQEKAR